ncbi:MAG: hypothetical protein HY691_01220 [Chloroflexi bacterium]|nr:hypothetical protein [Chloroflexota bacterium]
MVFPLMQLTTRGWIAEWSRVTSGASFVEAGPTLLHCAWTASRQIVNSGVKRLIHAFTSRVGERPQVRKVLLEATGTGPRIWTVIEGEPFKPELRKPIYEAELEAMQISPDVVADFRLVNISEQECDSLDQMLPANAEVVWQR